MTSSPRTSPTAAVHSRGPESRKAGSFLLFCAFLLTGLGAGACSSTESPGNGTGGSFGVGGNAPVINGAAGAGGADGSCFTSDICIPSCASEIIVLGTGTCDAAGKVVCDNGFVPKSSCAPNACAQTYSSCCDDTTGQTARPACGSDGLLAPCPAGSRVSHDVCIPSVLGVPTCVGLQGTACTLADQACSEGNYLCTCRPTPVVDAYAGAGTTWSCITALP